MAIGIESNKADEKNDRSHSIPSPESSNGNDPFMVIFTFQTFVIGLVAFVATL
jgi:hypothetical protein